MKDLAAEIVRIAKAEVGIEEIDGTNCGPRVNQYKATTWLPADQPWPWCAAFVCWVIREAFKSAGADTHTGTFSIPQTAGAWDFENWSMKQDLTTWTRKPHRGDIQPGDICVFTFSHIGFAASAPDADGFVRTLEGNTDAAGSREGGGVFAKRRHISKIRSRIRFRQDKLIPA
jgi:hypothetical protein